MATITASGSWWELDSDGLLRIFCTGDMPDNAWSSYTSDILTVTIENTVTSICRDAFANCTSLTSVTIPDSVTVFGYGAFRKCTALTSVTIPDSVTTIGNYAFADCWALASVSIGNSVTDIGDYVFSYCYALASITIPDSVTSIGSYAFRNCTSLASITISDSVTVIWGYAFEDCDRLSDVYYSGSQAQWNQIDIKSAGNAPLTSATKHYNYSPSPSLASIAVTTPPTKTAYTTGETFDPAGMIVTATYSDSTTAAVTGYSISPDTALTISDTIITISYTENGVTATDTVSITVNPPSAQTPTITTHPTGASYTVNDTATALFVTASVSDGGTLSYQWYRNNINSTSGGTIIPGATSASYTPPTTTAGTVYYYCVITNTLGQLTASATSNVAAIVVSDPSAQNPTITTQPVSASYTAGDTAAPLTVSASVTDGGTLSYQWYSNGANTTTGGTAISGATTDSYTPDTSATGTTYYYCVVTNTQGGSTADATSYAAAVIVSQGGGQSVIARVNYSGASRVIQRICGSLNALIDALEAGGIINQSNGGETNDNSN